MSVCRYKFGVSRSKVQAILLQISQKDKAKNKAQIYLTLKL